MNCESSDFIRINYRKNKRTNHKIYCTTCNTCKKMPRHSFRNCEIRNYHSIHLNYYEILKLYNICLECQYYFALEYRFRKLYGECNCHMSSLYLCKNCNIKVSNYIYRYSNCQCEKCCETYPNLCKDPIYHRFCDCEYHIFAEHTEVQYDKNLGDDYFHPEKFHNTFLFNRHHKKSLNIPDNWNNKEPRRIRYIEPCSTKSGGQAFYMDIDYFYSDWYEKNFLYFQYWGNYGESKTFQKLHFKCEHCSKKAIFESNDGEYLCYDCNDKIESEIENEIEKKVLKLSKFNVKKYKKEYEYNSGRKLHKKRRTTKNNLKDYDDFDYKKFSNTRTRVLISDKKILKIEHISQQSIPPFWCETIYSNPKSWKNVIAPEKEIEKKAKYEQIFPKLNSYTCSVCFGYSGDKTKCNHLVCENCLGEWFKIKRNCPICRSIL